MRYNEIITEANYRNKIDTSRTYPTQAEFNKALSTKFGATNVNRESNPQAGGGIYLMSDRGIVGYKTPNADSPEGFVWYLAKEPFMPASKKKSDAPAATAVTPTKATAPILRNIMRPHDLQYGYTAAVGDIPLSMLGGVPEYKAIKAYLATKPGMDLQAEVSTDSNYKTSWMYSKKLTYDQLIKSLMSKSIKPVVLPKVEPKPVPKVEVQDALRQLLRYVASIKASSMWGNYDARGPERDGDGWMAEIRDWGNWQLPAGADPSDDEYQDYDWEELSYESSAKLQSIVDDFSKQYPNIAFSWQTGEKNWIYFHAKAK
jgi:hypothetical protein